MCAWVIVAQMRFNVNVHDAFPTKIPVRKLSN